MSAKNTYIAYLQLPEDLQARLKEYRETLKRTFNTVSVPVIEPHITLMRMDVKAEYENELLDALRKIENPMIRVQPKNLKKLSRSALVFLVDRKEELHDLHIKVGDTFAEFKDEPVQVPPKYYEKRESIEKYGSPFFGEDYEPHITLGYTVESIPKGLPDAPSLAFETSEIVIAKKPRNNGKPYARIARLDFT